MNDKPQPSDEEIQRHMNFDRLLETRKIAITSVRKNVILKWTGSALIATVATVCFFYLRDKPEYSINARDKNQPDTDMSTRPIQPILPPDSIEVTGHRAEKDLQRPPENVPDGPKAQVLSERDPHRKESVTLPAESDYVQAEPVNGYQDLYSYFNSNIVYPPEALKDSVQGVQTISFIIGVDGKPRDLQILQSLGEPFEKECRRLIDNMPTWKPATLNGKPVASKVSLPLTFQIQKIKE